jgi:hypothetical protein
MSLEHKNEVRVATAEEIAEQIEGLDARHQNFEGWKKSKQAPAKVQPVQHKDGPHTFVKQDS